MAQLAASTPVMRRRPGRGAVLGSVLLHVLVGVAAWYASRSAAPDLPDFIVYRVNIVSPPPQVEGPPEPVVQQPQRVVQPEPRPAPQPRPQPQPQRPQPRPAQEEAKPEPPKPTTGASARQDSPGGENLNVQIDGEAFPYPEYLENITRQIARFFRWSGPSGLTARLYFVINRDGSVSDLRVLQGSGNVHFDFEALGAVETAAARGAFGPHPEGYVPNRLPVSIKFYPPR